MSRKSTSIFKRYLDALFAPAQDPRQVFSDPYEAAQQARPLLAQVQRAQAESASLQDRLQGRIQHLQAQLPQLQEHACRALQAGREDQARLYLQRRQVMLLELGALGEQLQATQNEQQRLSVVRQRLEAQIETLSARQQVLAARYNAALAQVRLSESLSGASQELSNLGQALEQAEHTAEHMQARAAAIHHLFEAGVLESPALPASDPLLQQLDQFDLAQSVEDQLASLKRQAA
ncbi:MAG: PspA/IM30 family protein [Chloroflexota bacterium]